MHYYSFILITHGVTQAWPRPPATQQPGPDPGPPAGRQAPGPGGARPLAALRFRGRRRLGLGAACPGRAPERAWPQRRTYTARRRGRPGRRPRSWLRPAARGSLAAGPRPPPPGREGGTDVGAPSMLSAGRGGGIALRCGPGARAGCFPFPALVCQRIWTPGKRCKQLPLSGQEGYLLFPWDIATKNIYLFLLLQWLRRSNKRHWWCVGGACAPLETGSALPGIFPVPPTTLVASVDGR